MIQSTLLNLFRYTIAQIEDIAHVVIFGYNTIIYDGYISQKNCY